MIFDPNESGRFQAYQPRRDWVSIVFGFGLILALVLFLWMALEYNYQH